MDITDTTDKIFAQAHRLVMLYGWNAMAYQILNAGMRYWFSANGNAVIGYKRYGRYAIVAGAPICTNEQLTIVVDEFERTLHQQGVNICYFGAGTRLVEALAARGPWDRVLLGAQPVWNPSLGRWQATLASKPSLRGQLNRAANKGVRMSLWQPERASQNPALEQCLSEWLSARGLPPLGFLVEPYILDNLNDRRIFVAEQQNKVVGFLIASPVPQRKGWLIEQIIRGQGAPNGTNELLFDAAMRQFADECVEYVTLGLSPLARKRDIGTELPSSSERCWLRAVFSLVRTHGRRFYNFGGLETFKAKFMPDYWEPIYAVTGQRSFTVGTLYAIAGVFGGMSPVLLAIKALGLAVRQEWSQLCKRTNQ